MEKLPPELLRELLKYNPESGLLWWLPRTPDHFTDGLTQSAEQKCAAWNGRFANKPAMRVPNRDGYSHGKIFAQEVSAHRVIWALNYGEWPQVIDHIDGDNTNNRLDNLRSVSPLENARNAARDKSNKSGVLGVSQRQRNGKWVASIRIGSGQRIWLGEFGSFDDAVAARKAAEREHGYHENHGREPVSAA